MRMSIHDEVQEQIPAYALGALEAQEAANVEAHLITCARCTRVLDEYRGVAATLALAAPSIKPSPDLKIRTMRRAMREGRSSAPRSAVVTPREPWWRRLGLAPSLAAAALVVTLITLLWTAREIGQLAEQLALQRDFTTVIAYAQGSALDVHGTAVAPLAEGRLYTDSDSNVAALVSVQLPPLAAGHVYQVWLTERNGPQVNGGSFTINAAGDGWLLIRAQKRMGTYSYVQVTAEPVEGSPAPTTAPVLAAEIPSP